MSEKRATTSGGYTAKHSEARAGEPLARLSDHLGRLLAHADKLLAEWQAHADALRGRFEREAEASGQILARTLEAALADASKEAAVQLQKGFGGHAGTLRSDLERARQAAADLEAHMRRIAGGAGPTSVDQLRAGLQGIATQLTGLRDGSAGGRRGLLVAIGLTVTANAMLAAILYVLLRPAPAPEPPPPEPEPVAVVTPPDAAPPPPPPPPPCGQLALEGTATAARLAAACVAELCPTDKKLGDCAVERDAAADLLAALQSLDRDKALNKLACSLPDADAVGRRAVTVRWLLDCPLKK